MRKVIVEARGRSQESSVILHFHPNLTRTPLRYINFGLGIEGVEDV